MTSLPGSRKPEVDSPERGIRRHLNRIDAISQVAGRAAVPLLRISLGIVYIWFGALKLTDATPVAALVAHTVPFLPEKVFVPALGVFEVVLGLGLLVGRYLGIVALLMVAHLGGTFLVLITQPEEAFQHGNPLMLSMVGEFVVKNVVLITAGLLLATLPRRTRESRHVAKHAQAEPVAPPMEPVVVTPAVVAEPFGAAERA